VAALLACTPSSRWIRTLGRVPNATLQGQDDDDYGCGLGRLQPGDTVPLTLYYHGNLIDRYDNCSTSTRPRVYPKNQQGRDLANFRHHLPQSQLVIRSRASASAPTPP